MVEWGSDPRQPRSNPNAQLQQTSIRPLPPPTAYFSPSGLSQHTGTNCSFINHQDKARCSGSFFGRKRCPAVPITHPLCFLPTLQEPSAKVTTTIAHQAAQEHPWTGWDPTVSQPFKYTTAAKYTEDRVKRSLILTVQGSCSVKLEEQRKGRDQKGGDKPPKYNITLLSPSRYINIEQPDNREHAMPSSGWFNATCKTRKPPPATPPPPLFPSHLCTGW